MSSPERGGVFVEGMAPERFDAFAGAHGEQITRTLILCLYRAELGRAAATVALARARSRWRTLRERPHPEAWALRAGLAWGRRRMRRTPPLAWPNVPLETPERGYDPGIDRALARLELSVRTILVLSFYLAWPDELIGRVQHAPALVTAQRRRVALRRLEADVVAGEEPLEERLQQHLAAAGRAHEVTAPSPAVLRRRALWRSVRFAAGAAAFLAALIAVVAWLGAGSGTSGSISTATGLGAPDLAEPGAVPDELPATVPVPAAGGAAVIEPMDPLPGPELVWRRALPSDARIDRIVTLPDRFVGFEGFEPGTALLGRPGARVWTSTAGGALWEDTTPPSSVFGPDDVIFDVVVAGSRLVAVGAEAGPRRRYVPPEALIIWSTSDGREWVRSEIVPEFTVAPPEDFRWSPGIVSLAGSADGAVIAAAPFPALDLEPLMAGLVSLRLRDEVFYAVRDGHAEAITAAGIVVERVPLTELGLSGDLEPRLTETPEPRLWYSPDGVEWESPASAAIGLEGAQVADVAGTADGFFMWVFDSGSSPRAFESNDGRSWRLAPLEEATGPADPFLRTGVVVWGDGQEAVVGAASISGPTVWTTTPNGDGVRVALRPLIAPLNPAEAAVSRLFGGALGLFAWTAPDQFGREPFPAEIVVATDGVRLVYSPTFETLEVWDDATGDQLFRIPDGTPGRSELVPVDVAAGTLTVLDPESRGEVATIGWDEWESAWIAAYAAPQIAGGVRLWFSPDGRSWNGVLLQDPIPEGLIPLDAAVGSESVALIVGDGGIAERLGRLRGTVREVWVGTPASG